MSKEIIEYLQLAKGKVILDCTIGSAGHAYEILKEIGQQGHLIGIDRDNHSLKIAKDRLTKFKNSNLVQGNFRHLDVILADLKINKVDGIIFDLGISSFQLDCAERGFSFRFDAPLDMRMDRNLKLSAFDLVNFLPEEGLSEILKKYGQERWHYRIARTIVRERKKSIIVTTRQLADLIARAVPLRYSRIHPATRSFLALRIAVNDELDALSEALLKSVDYLKPGARICVISFHSLEDRIVKHRFRDFAKQDRLKIITKKPLKPTLEEISANPRSRSAKMRVAEKEAE